MYCFFFSTFSHHLLFLLFTPFLPHSCLLLHFTCSLHFFILIRSNFSLYFLFCFYSLLFCIFYVYCIFILCPLFNLALHSTFSFLSSTFENYFLSPHLNSTFACFLILICYTIFYQFLLVAPLNFHILLSCSFSSHYVLGQFTLSIYLLLSLVSHNFSFFHFFVLFLIAFSLLYVFLGCLPLSQCIF